MKSEIVGVHWKYVSNDKALLLPLDLVNLRMLYENCDSSNSIYLNEIFKSGVTKIVLHSAKLLNIVEFMLSFATNEKEKRFLFFLALDLYKTLNCGHIVLSLVSKQPVTSMSRYNSKHYISTQTPSTKEFMHILRVVALFENFCSGKLEMDAINNVLSERINVRDFIESYLSEKSLQDFDESVYLFLQNLHNCMSR